MKFPARAKVILAVVLLTAAGYFIYRALRGGCGSSCSGGIAPSGPGSADRIGAVPPMVSLKLPSFLTRGNPVFVGAQVPIQSALKEPVSTEGTQVLPSNMNPFTRSLPTAGLAKLPSLLSRATSAGGVTA